MCRHAFAFMLCLSLVETSVTAADPIHARQQTHIEAQPLTAALHTLAEQRDIQFVYVSEELKGLQTRGVTGDLELREALQQLLIGTELTFRFIDDDTVAIGPNESSRPEQQSSLEIERVIVTAQRREQDLQEVPLSITALSEAKLRALGAYEFADFASTVPGLTFNEFGHNDGSFIIRGVSSSMTGSGIQSTVATYIDDLPSMDTYAGLSNPDLYLFDVNRVEVLRGPQGTLFGSGAMGGAVRVITNKPDSRGFAAVTDMVYSDTARGEDSYGVSAMVNVPLISDKLAMRVVGYQRDNGGWVDNATLGKDRNDVRTVGGRFMLSYSPIADLTLTGTVTYQNSEPEDGSSYNSVIDGKRVRTRLVPEKVDDEFTVYNLVAEYQFSGMKLRSSTTFADKQVYEQQDATPNSRATFGPATPASNLNWQETSDNFFQEFHLFSTTDAPLSWFVGAFYRDQGRRHYDFSWIVPGSESRFGSGAAGAPGDDVYSFINDSETTEKAVFGEVGYRITPQLEATVGMRYFENSYRNLNTSSGYLNAGLTTQRLQADENKATYKFVLSYTLDDDAMIYAQAAQGYRVGNANSPVPDPVPPTFGPDSIWNYEVGAKTAWFERRLQLNGALYYIDWSDMQLSQYTPGGWFFVDNVGATRSKGAELEIQFELNDRFSYSGGLAWNDAEILVDSVALNARAGDRVPGVPHFTFSNQFQYQHILEQGLRTYARLNHQYTGGSYSSFDLTTAVPMGDYNLFGLRVGAAAEHWDVSLFVNNLLDDDAVGVASGTNQVYLLRPRTIGMNVRFTF